ncbi:alpha-L-rhamnosidase C-terminal domain-containing protein [Massilibacteroides sp.]|uniref:alpha-L-rhamnosidase-related protein n=1 Tax=Massilibacteroides sp. TaxID=2034766 RepID=UPI00262689BA|nr:alpha-L-rhamnosidase C-terminal domain-containing protein [Massilibacteroides sp.]MDD4515117.1 alpha-L-rhamnosidase N-terminal domain-containing protein [Massilibacteroides sp.]
MRTLILLLSFLLWIQTGNAQIRLAGFNQKAIDKSLYDGRWKARWIAVPNEPANTFGVYHFRKNIELEEKPNSFVVHVSADNRYKLYVNGTEVSAGPARGDIYNWNFETIDIAPWLKSGKNTLAAIVWNYADKKPVAQISFNQTGFILQGNTEKEYIVNTDNTWLCYVNKAYSPINIHVPGYYVAGPGEKTDAALYPWGWEKPDFDDTSWLKAQNGIEGAMKGARDYPGRLLVPSPIPPMENKTERFSAVRMEEGIKTPAEFPAKAKDIIVPANSKVRLLLDNQVLMTGYLSVLFSKGKSAEITLGYAEALYEKETDTRKGYSKGNRNEVENKRFIGYEDKIVADGGEHRLSTSLWWRTWRYVNVTIETKDSPLVIHDIYGTYSAYPFRNETAFSVPGHEELNKMLEIGWRTARLCANETYMDCPYYEQLQYFGDTRIQAMISLYNSTDQYMVKNAIEQGRQSIVADGITMSRYPSNLHQFISSFSLWWINMGHDYWMYIGDETYVKTLLPAFRGVLAWYEQWLKPNNSLDFVPHWFFADWSEGFPHGEPIREKNGNSSFQDLMYLLTLDAAAEMEDAIGIPSIATHYRSIASAIRTTFKQYYWDSERQLFADTHDHRSYSQHVNALAVIAGIIEGEDAKGLMRKTLTDTSLAQATIYFRYYVHQALDKAGMGDELLDNLKIWNDQMALGLTTWAEKPEPSRSDCHAWGSSPNIEFYRILLGIDSSAPGFSEVCISPALGKLKEASGSIPHPKGKISVSYKIDKKGVLTAEINLPESVTGTFVWKNETRKLNGGKQTIII